MAGTARWAALAVVLACAAPARASAAAPAVVLTASPGQVSLTPGDSATVTLVVANPTDAAVNVVAVDVAAPARVTAAKPAPAAFGTVAAHGVGRAALKLAALAGFEEGDVGVLVEVASADHHDVLSATVAVKRGTAAQALSAAVVSVPGKIGDGHRARAELRIANDTPFDFTNVAVIGVGAQDITVSATKEGLDKGASCNDAASGDAVLVGCFAELKAGGARLLAATLTVANNVHVGTQHVTFIVSGAPNEPADSAVPPSSAVVTASIDLNVFGIDALGPLGVASAFVLPGLMAALLFLLLSRFVYPRNASTPDTVDVKDPKNLVFVVPVGVIAYFVYWRVWGVDLTDAIGTQAVLDLFLLGAAIGLVAWGAFAVVYMKRSGRQQFSKNDDPVKTLKRIAWRHAGLTVPQVTKDGLAYCHLGPARDGGMTVAPTIVPTFAENVDSTKRAAFDKALERDDVEAIVHAAEAKTVKLKWKRTSGVVVFPAEEAAKAVRGTDTRLVEAPVDGS
jgi:hypothetical protein